ncbi:hypothetical protein Patl1_02624 [Pistacia atlantica]|uniref:Uncharacterized protein n=1 Tax=Pistacia atlantica TaxID=434234 RepID=A0ACC1C9H4_9ROSI|nr:hypothetical protein Patl1_02624 [Pistacia atlantica]
MAINLTEGAIELICKGDVTTDNHLIPVLQVMDLKLVVSKQQQQQQQQRFRMVLSDGSLSQQGMLATQRNELVHSGQLQIGSVVRLTKFTCNVIQNRMIVIVMDLEVIMQNCKPIGKPVPAQRPSAPAQVSNDQLRAVTGNPQHYGGSSLAGGSVDKSNVTGTSPQHANRSMNHLSGTSYSSNSDPASYVTTNETPSYSKPEPGARFSGIGAPVDKPNVSGTSPQHANMRMNQLPGNSYSSNSDPARYVTTNETSSYSKSEPGARFSGGSGSFNNQNMSFGDPRLELSRSYQSNYARTPQPAYMQPPAMYGNRGQVAKSETLPRIIPIGALNPYQGKWTIKARVTSKGELRHYNNQRGDGKVFHFDLLDSDGGEIRATCFNAVVDQFYHQVEAGKVYLISRGTLKPAQKTFNHLHNDLEIFLDTTSMVQLCVEDDNSIPQQQFHFCSISDIEAMENNSVVDVIGVVSFISPAASIMRKNGTETHKRTLHLKDMSGRSVELTLWGTFCNDDGQRLQEMCDSGIFPVLAVKSARVNDFNGKAVGTILSSQLFMEPDFPEAHKLREWFDKEGKNIQSVSISRETLSVVRSDIRKTISQIKDEGLGTKEKPDWITVNATVVYIKFDNFCYTACPIMIVDRPCNKKVTNNGDGRWHCDRCDQSIAECDYRYILQFQIQDHTGLTWVNAFQECGEEILGISAKDLYYLKYVDQNEEKFSETLRNATFSKYIFKLKVKEETFGDEQRVKSTVVKVEKYNHSSDTRFLLDMMDKLKSGDLSSYTSKAESSVPNSGMSNRGAGSIGNRQPAPAVANYVGTNSNASRDFGLMANQMGQYGNQYSGSRLAVASTPMQECCSSCGAAGHSSANCPSIMSGPGQSMAGGYSNRVSPGVGGGASGECYKCHKFGHWAKDCPGLNTAPPAYGSSGIGISPGRYGNAPRQQVGGF